MDFESKPLISKNFRFSLLPFDVIERSFSQHLGVLEVKKVPIKLQGLIIRKAIQVTIHSGGNTEVSGEITELIPGLSPVG